MCELINQFKKEIHSDFINAMKDTPFGPIFMAFYNEKFGINKSLKSKISVLKIVKHYNKDSRCFNIGGERIQLMLEDVALMFGLPMEGDNFIMNKMCTLKDMDVIKHYFKNVKNITKISIEEALDDLLRKKERELN